MFVYSEQNLDRYTWPIVKVNRLVRKIHFLGLAAG